MMPNDRIMLGNSYQIIGYLGEVSLFFVGQCKDGCVDINLDSFSDDFHFPRLPHLKFGPNAIERFTV